MVATDVKSKIYDVLKHGYFTDCDDSVSVLDGDGGDGDLHVVIVSRKFDGRRLREKNDMIWSEFLQKLEPCEWGMVSLSIGVSPEELKSRWE